MDRSINVTSIVGLKTKEAIVQVEITGQAPVQLSASEARDVAISLLQCAESAEVDLFLWGFAIEKIGANTQEAAAIINEFRLFRAARQSEMEGNRES